MQSSQMKFFFFVGILPTTNIGTYPDRRRKANFCQILLTTTYQEYTNSADFLTFPPSYDLHVAPRLRKIFSVTPIFGVDFTLEDKPADPNQSFVPRQEERFLLFDWKKALKG